MWEFSHHARKRGVDMCLSGEEISECLYHPRRRFKNKRHQHGDNQWFYVGPRFMLVVNETTHIVITILWNDHTAQPNRGDMVAEMARIRDKGSV